MASSLSDPVAALSCLMSLMAWEWGFTHEIGSVCSASLPSTAMPPTAGSTTLTIANGTAVRCGRLPRNTATRLRRPWLKSLPSVGDLYSRMPSTASVARMLHRHTAMIPITSREPNSRMAGVLANYRAMKANTASKVTTSRAGPRLRAAAWIGCAAWSRITSSSMRECIWIA